MENLDTQALLAAGAAIGTIRQLEDGRPFVVLPDGYKTADLESLHARPARKRGNVVTTTSGSFCHYTKQHGSLDACTLYADIDAEKSTFTVLAVINDHASDYPQWRDHQCRLTTKLSVEWKRWTEKNAKPMTQIEFATWLEDNLGDITGDSPSGAQMLQMALAFEANADKRLSSKVALQNGGVNFTFVDDEDKDTKTTMQAFQRFTLALPVFEGSTDAYKVEARLKYRENGGKLSFWYELIRPDRAFRTAVSNTIAEITLATGFPVLYGTP